MLNIIIIFQAYQELYYEKMDAEPLKDMSLLPFALHDKCAGNPIYWVRMVSSVNSLSTKGTIIKHYTLIFILWNIV